MNKEYIEYLLELKYALEEIENSGWYKWIDKSISKYNENMDVSYYLGAYGGCGSLSDITMTSEITNVLTSITYDMAKSIKQNGTYCMPEILNKHKEYRVGALDYCMNKKDYWHKEKDIEEHTNGLNYVNHLIGNYSYGNLHQITCEYLESKQKTRKI